MQTEVMVSPPKKKMKARSHTENAKKYIEDYPAQRDSIQHKEDFPDLEDV